MAAARALSSYIFVILHVGTKRENYNEIFLKKGFVASKKGKIISSIEEMNGILESDSTALCRCHFNVEKQEPFSHSLNCIYR